MRCGLPAQTNQFVKFGYEVDALDNAVGDLQQERANRLAIGGGDEAGTVILIACWSMTAGPWISSWT